MAKTTKKRLRAAWLQVHKWIGIALAVLIIPISLTGALLVWHDWLDAQVEPQRYEVIAPATLPVSAYADAARAQLKPGQTLSALRFSPDGAPVVATAVKPAEGAGRPQRTSLWLDPRDGKLIDQSTGNQGLVQVMHVIHGSMMIPGGWGRPIVGWVGVFMFLSCLTGLWLWWPLSGNIKSGFQWQRRNTLNANLHYMTGFWILIPLAMLSFTGAWISFPKMFGQFEKRPPAAAGPSREAAARAKPLTETVTPVDAAVASAGRFATGPLATVTWPTDMKGEWKVGYVRTGGTTEVVVDDADATATPPKPPQPETIARTMRRWHDGTNMGVTWQVLIFLGGIIPVLLTATGLIIWWRARGPRQRARDAQRLA